jgi:hypothetical protein
MGRRKQINNPTQSAEGELNGEEIQEIINWIEHRISDHFDAQKRDLTPAEHNKLSTRIAELENVKMKINDHLRNR